MSDRIVTGDERKPWQTLSLDVADCSRFEAQTPLSPKEAAGISAFPGSWPDEVRNALRGEVDQWLAGNPARRLLAVTWGLSDHVPPNAVLIIHHCAVTEGE